MGRLFGTDGVRGIVPSELDSSLAMKVGEAAGYVLGKDTKKLTVLIGRDTRKSGQMLLYALASGLMNYGAHVIDIGIVPTPAVSYLVKKYKATIGIMISASHNPSEHNGIKLFNGEGYKLDDNIENEIEKYILDESIPKGTEVGTFETKDLVNDYIDYVASSVDKINAKLKVVVDCAYGSASTTAPSIFKKLGLKATFINTEYNGDNINDNAGSTHLEGLTAKVKSEKADLGIAYDGDADRCLMLDKNGNLVDGDFIMAIVGKSLKEKGELTNNTIVGTVMSNLGLRKFCEEYDISFEATKVGDRYVLEKMLEKGYIIGGEQSGHIIFKALANTGDGQLTSVQMLGIMSKENKPLDELASVMRVYPQVLVNVKVNKEGKEAYKENAEITDLIASVEEELAGDGRVLIRPSGTEDLVRVMLEGKDEEDIKQKANLIADKIKEIYGA